MPNPETKAPETPEAPNQATALLSKLEKEKVITKTEDVAQDESKWIYVHWCRRDHPAIFYTKNPVDKTIGPNEWYARYKRQDEPWRGPVLCQECSKYDADGYITVEEPIQVTYMPQQKRQTHFVPDRRFVYRIGKTEEMRKKHKPHRAAILPITAANVGVQNPDFPESVKTIRRRQLVEANVAEVSQ